MLGLCYCSRCRKYHNASEESLREPVMAFDLHCFSRDPKDECMNRIVLIATLTAIGIVPIASGQEQKAEKGASI